MEQGVVRDCLCAFVYFRACACVRFRLCECARSVACFILLVRWFVRSFVRLFVHARARMLCALTTINIS